MRHSKEELQIINNYKKSVDLEVRNFVEKVYGGEHVQPITVGFLTDRAAIEIEHLTGMMVYGNRIVLDDNAVIHIKNRHGIGGEQDESMKNIDDIARIGYVLAKYDNIEFYGEYAQGYVDTNGKQAPKVVVIKKINGTFYVVEAVSDAKKHRNYIVSAFIKPADRKSDSSVPNNAYALGKRPKRS